MESKITEKDIPNRHEVKLSWRKEMKLSNNKEWPKHVAF